VLFQHNLALYDDEINDFWNSISRYSANYQRCLGPRSVVGHERHEATYQQSPRVYIRFHVRNDRRASKGTAKKHLPATHLNHSGEQLRALIGKKTLRSFRKELSQGSRNEFDRDGNGLLVWAENDELLEGFNF